MSSVKSVDLIWEEIMTNGGATWYPGKDAPETGYMVSQFGNELKIKIADFTPSTVATYQAVHAPVMAHNDFYGAWVYEGYVYLDVSRQYLSRSQAHTMAQVNAQLAYWDVARQVSIDL